MERGGLSALLRRGESAEPLPFVHGVDGGPVPVLRIRLGPIDAGGPQAAHMGGEWSKLRAKKVLAALRDPSSIPRRQLETKERLLVVRVMRADTPVARPISRHTRALLRAYFKAGKISTRIADRDVVDRFVEMTPPERILYDEVERYISETYNQASAKEKSAVGFVLTIYRKRLASSFHALRKTLENHLAAIDIMGRANGQPRCVDEDDIPDDDETLDDAPDADEATEMERQALTLEEKGDIKRLLNAIRALPPDTKLRRLLEELAALRAGGHRQVMVFTGYTDTPWTSCATMLPPILPLR